MWWDLKFDDDGWALPWRTVRRRARKARAQERRLRRQAREAAARAARRG